MATSPCKLGEFGQATAIAEESARIAEALQQPASLLVAQVSVCVPLLRQGAFHAAIPRLERALALYNATALHAWDLSTASALGYAYAMVQRFAEALPILDDAAARVTSNRIHQALALADLGEAYLHAGRQDDAQTIAERILALCRERGERGGETRALYLFGEIYAHRLPLAIEQAEAHYRQALVLAEELGMRPLQAHCHLGLGTLYAKSSRPEQARSELSAAMALYRAMEMTFWLPQVEAALAQGWHKPHLRIT